MEPLSPELAEAGSEPDPELAPAPASPFGSRPEPFSDQSAEKRLQSCEKKPGVASGRSVAGRTPASGGRDAASAGTRKTRAIRARAGRRRWEGDRGIWTSGGTAAAPAGMAGRG